MRATAPDGNNVISFIILSRNHLSDCEWKIESTDAYWIPEEEALQASTIRTASLQSAHPHDGNQQIRTPWVLLLEEDEFLRQEDMDLLVDFCRRNETSPAQLSIRRFVTTDFMSHFSWVTTASRMKNALGSVRAFQTVETRLFPTILLNSLQIEKPTAECPTRFSIKFDCPQPSSVSFCPALISRKSSGDLPVDPRPKDRDVFRHGHQQYFNDQAFSARFEWPHTGYRTIRHDHVPSIIEALKQGLSNARIVSFTLLYLLRMRFFSEALEILKWIPEHWYSRYPDLTNGAAAFYFISGNAEEAIALYERILTNFPDADWIARNAVKLNILSERYHAVDGIFHQYHGAAGKELIDEYYEEFERVHGKAPLRTATLSACLIVKDEEDLLERAITSIKPMADEIIVVDTGSCDRSAEIGESLGARIYHFPWNDDFSSVRNFAIEKATCDYVFMLDADEYISPLFFFESKTLKKILPLKEQRAFSLPIGSYFNKTDWLFVMEEEGNFRMERSAVRIFPRRAGLTFTGRIGESIEPALRKEDVPIQILSHEILHIVHEHRNRKARVERKLSAYEKMSDPEESIILAAIRDYSYVGHTGATIGWLRSFYDRHSDSSDNMRFGLHLAGILAESDLQQADYLYRDLISTYPDSPEIVLKYADFLVINNRIHEIANIQLPEDSQEPTPQSAEMACFRSLKSFESGKAETAFEELTNVLDRNAYAVFPQALRLYYLSSLGDLEGVVAALDSIFTLLGRRKDLNIDSIEDIFAIAEELYGAMLKGSFRKERSFILHGMTKLGHTLGVS